MTTSPARSLSLQAAPLATAIALGNADARTLDEHIGPIGYEENFTKANGTVQFATRRLTHTACRGIGQQAQTDSKSIGTPGRT